MLHEAGEAPPGACSFGKALECNVHSEGLVRRRADRVIVSTTKN